MASKGQKQRIYDEEFKTMIVNKHVIEGLSYATLSQKYDVSSGTILTWVRKLKYSGTLVAGRRGRQKPPTEAEYKEKYEILKKFQTFCEEVDRKKK